MNNLTDYEKDLLEITEERIESGFKCYVGGIENKGKFTTPFAREGIITEYRWAQDRYGSRFLEVLFKTREVDAWIPADSVYTTELRALEALER